MATRKKRKQRTTKLLAASALLTSVAAPYVVQAEEISSTTTNLLESGSSVAVTAQTVASVSTGDSSIIEITTGDTTIINPTQTVFDQLQPGSYHIGFTASKQPSLFKLTNSLTSLLPAQVEVTENKQYRITLHINRNTSSPGHSLEFIQQEKTIDYEILSHLTKNDRTIVPTTLVFTVDTLNEPITLNGIIGTSTKLNTVLTFDETMITESEKPVLPILSQIENGIYDVKIDGWKYSRKTWSAPNPESDVTILPDAQLEVINGKYFITAEFKGVDYSAKNQSEFNYYVYKVKSLIAPWTTALSDGVMLAYDTDTQISKFKFQVADPFSYSQIQPHRVNYNVTPEKDNGYASLYVQVQPQSLKKIDEVKALSAGNYTTNVYHKNFTTDAVVEKLPNSLGNQANIKLNTDGSALVTIEGLDSDISAFKLSNLTSPYLKQELKDSDGYTYAMEFEIPSLDTPIELGFSLKDNETGIVEEITDLYLDLNDVALKATDELVPFKPKERYTPFVFPYEDGEYSVDVRILEHSKFFPVTTDSNASKYVAFDKAKISVKDGEITLLGTLKPIGTWVYASNATIETNHLSYMYSPVTVLRDINQETGNFSQDISFKMNDLTGLYHLRYDSLYQTDGKKSGTVTVRVSVDANSIKPYVAPEDEGTDLTYAITPDTTNEMGEFVANYLSPYFEKPAKLKIEDGVPYAYVTVNGKMYVANADKFRYVAANGQEYPVEVVYDNGKTGQELIRTVKFPIHQKQMKLFVDSGAYGEYYLYNDFEIDESLLPETPIAPIAPEPGDNSGETGETPTPNPDDSTTTPDTGDVEQPTTPANPESLTHSFTAAEVTPGIYGSVPGSFIENYLKPYFTNAQLVTVDGKKYIEMTLTGKAYGISSFEGAEWVSSTGEKLEQVRVIRIPAAKSSTHRVNCGDYGIYDLTFNFNVTDEQIAPEPIDPDSGESGNTTNPGDGESGNTTNPGDGESGNTTNPGDGESGNTTNPGDGESGNTTNPGDGESGNTTNPGDGESGNTTNPDSGNNSGNTTNPDKPVTTAPIDITHSFTAVEVKAGTYGSVGGAFIENYLKPYFTNAQLVTVDGKKYIEMTLIGKGYGVVSFENATLVSSVGEKMDQVRVFRIPAAKVSTHEIDAGEYGIYDLTFTFGVTDAQLADAPGENTTPTIPATPAPATPDIPAPKAPSAPTTNEIVKDISKIKLNTATNILFTLDTNNALAKAIAEMIKEPKAKRVSDKELEITFTVEKKNEIKRITFFQNGKKIGEWTAPKMARLASLVPFFANTSEAVTLKVASTEGITFEVEETNGTVTTIGTAIEAKKTDLVTTSSNTGTGSGGGATVTPLAASDVEKRESISYKMVGDPNGPMADFMTNYMNPFFSNAELVTVSGKNYIEMTLTGKAYGFQNLRVTGGYKVISSVGEKMDQVRVIRFPAKKNVTIHVDSAELGYGAYDLLFTFDLSEEQMKNAAAAGTGGITAVQTITPQIVSEGEITFTIPAESSAIVAYAKKITSKIVDGQYEVAVTLATDTDLDTFIVTQEGKEIARWDKKSKTASLAATGNTNVLTFTTSSLEDLTFIATTKYRTIEAKVGATLPKQEIVPEVAKDGRTPMSYTMAADPAGPMADFISGYLAPYFSNAVYVLENGKEFVELTLTGKAYGFQKLQYIDADGKNVDIEVVSSKGEKMDQVRVVRLPLVQNKDGITKIFVDSGDLGYGAYTLFFKFNVPAKSANNETVKPAVANPFKDIDGIYSKDDILALYAAGITTGTTETTYSPNANMTRAQFAVMVARTLGISSTNETKFKDVQGKWYAKEVQALTEIGIIQGVSDTKFKPDDKITRQQAAVMIHRMLAHQGYTNTATAGDLNFKDSAKISDYAKEAFAELQAQGIMTGYEGKVNPTKNLTRAQMAKILKNAADLVNLLD